MRDKERGRRGTRVESASVEDQRRREKERKRGGEEDGVLSSLGREEKRVHTGAAGPVGELCRVSRLKVGQ